MFGEHPEFSAKVHYGYGCAWYSDHGPFYSHLQLPWLVFGVPCVVGTALALSSTCGLVCWPRRSHSSQTGDSSSYAAWGAGLVPSQSYGPLLDASDRDVDADGSVHRWVGWGSFGAVLYGVLLAVLGVFIILHANNEADFTFLVDALVALAMCASKLAVALCARTVHRHLSPLSRQVAKQWTLVLAFSKALTAVCALVLFIVYLVLAVQGVDANRGGGARRLQQTPPTVEEEEDGGDHKPTPGEQAELCSAGFFMVWSFLLSLLSQSIAGFALFRICWNASRMFGDPLVFHRVVHCWWGVLVGCTCGVGVALWLAAALCVFPALDISPLRMMGMFYLCAAASQVLAGCAMLQCNAYIRGYWQRVGSVAVGTVVDGTVVGNATSGPPPGKGKVSS